MHKITARQFQQAVEKDPAWAAKLTEPVEITDYCDMKDSPISHLSPLLHFTGKNDIGCTATFANCTKLKTAEGNFSGFVDFEGSHIQKIGQLVVSQPSRDGRAAHFRKCELLKVAEGEFKGRASFYQSGVEKIGDLKITLNGVPTDFSESRITVAEGTFPGAANFRGCPLEKIGDLWITGTSDGLAASFADCKMLKVAEGEFPGYVNFQGSGIERIGDLKITPDEGRYADWTGTPVLRKRPDEVVKKTFPGKSLPELKVIAKQIKGSFEDLVHTVEDYVKRVQARTLMKKDNLEL